MSKLDLVLKALEREEIAEWYEEQFGVTAGDFTNQNVNVYGTGGLGDLADMIISDAGLGEDG